MDRSANVILGTDYENILDRDPALGGTRQSAIRQAIETDGRVSLVFHASIDNQSGRWPWLTNTLNPVNYRSDPENQG